MFEITLGSKILERLNRLHEYCDIFQSRDKNLKNKKDCMK